MSIVSLYNIKGGVGKTAAAVNLSYIASRENNATLLIDLDPQGSATYYFRIRPSKKFGAKKLLKGGEAVEKYIKGTDFDNLDMLPAHLSFRSLDVLFHEKAHPKKRLQKILEPLRREYTTIILDCPPNISLESENVFRTSDAILVPFIPTSLSLLGYTKIIEFFDKQQLDHTRIKVFFSMVESRKNMHQDMVKQMLSEDPHFLNISIPYSSDVERMGIHREPVVVTKPRIKASVAFRQLWEQTRLFLSER